jgi:hypothetical protein
MVNGQLIEFKQSEFTTNLENLKNKDEAEDEAEDETESEAEDEVKFSFKNFSTKQQGEISTLFAQAKAQGFIDYHGYKINFPKNYSLQFDRTEFNFAEILQSFKSPDKTYDSGHE